MFVYTDWRVVSRGGEHPWGLCVLSVFGEILWDVQAAAYFWALWLSGKPAPKPVHAGIERQVSVGVSVLQIRA